MVGHLPEITHPAHLHADRRRPLQPHLPGRGRRGAGLGPAPPSLAPRAAHGARHVPRVPAHALARARRDPGSRSPSASAPTSRSTSGPSTSWSSSRVTSCAARPRPRPRSTCATRRAVGDHMADTLAALHDVDPDAVGLGDLGRHEGYIERQLKRWRGQYDQMQVEGVDHGGIVERVSDELARRIPKQQRTSVVHGDYRMDNVVLADDGTVRAILDWEICTLGDPLADVGLLMVYWADPDGHHGRARALADHGAGLLDAGRGPGALRLGLRPRRLRGRLLHGLRLLEAGLHPPGRLRPLRRRGRGGRPGQRGGLPGPDRAPLRDGGGVAGVGRREPRAAAV